MDSWFKLLQKREDQTKPSGQKLHEENRNKGELLKQTKMQKERRGEHTRTIWAGTVRSDLLKTAMVRWLEFKWKAQKEEIK